MKKSHFSVTKRPRLFTGFAVVLIAVLFAVTPPPSTTTTGGSFYMDGNIVGGISGTVLFEINNPTTARAMDNAGSALTGNLKQGDKVYQLSGNYDPDTRAINISTQSDDFVYVINGTMDTDGNIESGDVIVFNKKSEVDNKAADTFKIEKSSVAVSGGSAISGGIPDEFHGKWYTTATEDKPENDSYTVQELIYQFSPFGSLASATDTVYYRDHTVKEIRSSGEERLMIVDVQPKTEPYTYYDIICVEPSFLHYQKNEDVIDAFEAYLVKKEITDDIQITTKTNGIIDWQYGTPNPPNQWYCENGTITLNNFGTIRVDREWFDFQIAYLQEKIDPVTIYTKSRFWIENEKFYSVGYYRLEEQSGNQGYYNEIKREPSLAAAQVMPECDWEKVTEDNAMQKL